MTGQTKAEALIGATARHDGEFVAVTLFAWGSEMTVRLKPSQATALAYNLFHASNLATMTRWDRLADGTEEMMFDEVSAQEYVDMMTKKKTRKYRNEPTEVDGIRFDSKAEARRYSELMLMMAAGEIGEVVLQPRFVITVNGTKICTYVGDFEYHRRGTRVIEDVKGVKTPAYRIKKKLMKAVHGIEIEEIS